MTAEAPRERRPYVAITHVPSTKMQDYERTFVDDQPIDLALAMQLAAARPDRVTRLLLTSEGAAVLHQMAAGRREVLAEVLQRLEPEELAIVERAFELVALGVGLPKVLEALCNEVEELAPDSYCSIFLVNSSDGRFHAGAGPSLPPSLLEMCEGAEIDPGNGPSPRNGGADHPGEPGR